MSNQTKLMLLWGVNWWIKDFSNTYSVYKLKQFCDSLHFAKCLGLQETRTEFENNDFFSVMKLAK